MTTGAVTLRDHRQQTGLSLRDLEQVTGISRAVWSQVERGKLLPTPAQLAALSVAFGVPVDAWRISFRIELDAQEAAA